MRGLGRHVWRTAAIASAIIAGGGARAGAFLEPPGQGKVIITASFAQSLRAFDARGRVIAAGGYRKMEVSALGEYGALENLTLVVKPVFEDVSAPGAGPAPMHGPGWAEAGARIGLWQSSSQVVSAQAVVLAPNVAERVWGNNAGGAEARLLYGVAFDLFGAPAYADLQAGLRLFGGGLRDEFRLDATLGWRPAPAILALAQAFAILAPARGVRPAMGLMKAQASVVYDFNAAWSAQIGAFATLWGENTSQEFGLVTGLWRRF